MNWPIRFLIPLFLILAAAQVGRLQAQEIRAGLSRLVIVGDSISAGYQNSCLEHTQQPNGYATLLAQQAGVELPLPLISTPGFPPCLVLHSIDPLIIQRISPVPGLRIDQTVQAYNLSVPGIRVVDALKKIPDDDFHQEFFYPFSLIHQQVLLGHPPGMSQIDIAESLLPTTVVLWLGSNDVLWAVIGADPKFVTEQEVFEDDFAEIITRLAYTGATLVVGNVPDVSVIPFSRPVDEFIPPGLFAVLGVASGDRVTLPGLAIISDIVMGEAAPPLPPDVVLTVYEALEIQEAVDAYNAFIQAQIETLKADGKPVALVDTNAMLSFVENNGVTLAGRRLTTDFLGGLFTLDGIHPTNTAHAILANAFINVLNAEFDAGIRPLSVGRVNRILHEDPLVFKNVGNSVFGPGPRSEEVLRSLDFIREPVMAP